MSKVRSIHFLAMLFTSIIVGCSSDLGDPESSRPDEPNESVATLPPTSSVDTQAETPELPAVTPQTDESDTQAEIDRQDRIDYENAQPGDTLPDDFEALSEKEKIKFLEDKIRNDPNAIGWRTHNILWGLYSAAGDTDLAGEQLDIIFKKTFMNEYMLKICAGWKDEPMAAADELVRTAEKFPDHNFLTAACLIKAAEFQSPGSPSRSEILQRVVGMEGEGLERYRNLAESMLSR